VAFALTARVAILQFLHALEIFITVLLLIRSAWTAGPHDGPPYRGRIVEMGDRFHKSRKRLSGQYWALADLMKPQSCGSNGAMVRLGRTWLRQALYDACEPEAGRPLHASPCIPPRDHHLRRSPD